MPMTSLFGFTALVNRDVSTTFPYTIFFKLDGPYPSIGDNLEAAKAWCEFNATGNWYVQNGMDAAENSFDRYIIVSFEKENDAILMKLVGYK